MHVKGWLRFRHAHTGIAYFVSRRVASGGLSPVNTQIDESICCAITHGAVRFLLWWLFLHRRLRARQRGSRAEARERRSTHSADHFQRALLVFIQATQRSFRSFSKPFGFGQGVNSNGMSALCCSRTVRYRVCSPLPRPVGIPVSNFDYGWILHPESRMSSRKYFKFRPYSIGALWKSCGKCKRSPVDKIVENRRSVLVRQVKKV